MLESGEMIPGYVPPDELVSRLDAEDVGLTLGVAAACASSTSSPRSWVVLGWLSFEMRTRNRDVSQVLFAFTILAAVALVAAALGLY